MDNNLGDFLDGNLSLYTNGMDSTCALISIKRFFMNKNKTKFNPKVFINMYL